MRLKVDKANGALYFRLDESEIVESEEVQPGVILDQQPQNSTYKADLRDLR